MDDESSLVRAVLKLKFKKPFDPFRIVTNKGEKLLIPEPEMIVVPSRTAWVHVVQRSGRVERLAKRDIIAIEELKVMSVASLSAMD